jgi:hypothetical protein
LAILAAQTESAVADEKKPPNTMGDINNNQGIVTQGQIGNNTIIQNDGRRHLTEGGKQQFLAQLSRTRRIVITVYSHDGDNINLGREIWSFLHDSGFNVASPNHLLIYTGRALPRGVEVFLADDKPDEPIQIVVGDR